MRVMRRYGIPAICMTVCLAVAIVLCAYPQVQAAGRVDMERKGTLTLALAAEDSDQMIHDMADMVEPVPVRAWKLADMLESGRYAFREGFDGLSLEEEEWKNLAQDAVAMVYEVDGEGRPFGEPKMPPAYTGTMQVTEGGALEVAQDGAPEGRKGFSDMDLGLYLIMVDSAKSPKYRYDFAPLVVSLPWSEYQYVGEGASDAWQYEREVMLKPSWQPCFGKIKIIKTLTSYNASQGEVTFVFDVTAREGEEIVYSNVVSMGFSAVGIQETVLDGIPAGAMVTVKEIYSGANCQVTMSDEGPKVVVAEDGAEPVTFRFENGYDEDAKRGYGIENRFRYNAEKKTYEWTTDRPGIGMEPGDGAAGDPEGAEAKRTTEPEGAQERGDGTEPGNPNGSGTDAESSEGNGGSAEPESGTGRSETAPGEGSGE